MELPRLIHNPLYSLKKVGNKKSKPFNDLLLLYNTNFLILPQLLQKEFQRKHPYAIVQ